MPYYQRILCATDFSPASDEALEQAIALCEATGANLILAHCVEPFVIPNYPFAYVEVRDEIIDEGERQMKNLVDKHNLSKVETIIEDKNARTGIVELVEKLKIDIIVMGHRGQHGLFEKMLGSTTHYVINHVNCHVLVTHEKVQQE